MIVIASKTEQKLYKDLRKAIAASPAQKCFFMQFSKSPVDKKKLFETILKLLEDHPNSYMAQVYFCYDKDIFITMQGFMQSQFAEFIQKLCAALKTKDLMNMIEVFELGVHWQKLEALCKEKIDAAQDAQHRLEEERRKAVSNKKTLEVLSELDPNLIRDVATRRTKRETPIILVVDDDQLSRTLVGNVLHKDFDVKYAKTGAGALREYLVCAPDVMFLDIGLPDINGHEVLESLFQLDPNAYVIMFSGRKDKENIMRALEAGAQGFVGKPFTRENLFEHIKKSPFISDKTSMKTAVQRAL